MITVPYTKVLQLAVEMSMRTYPPSVEQAGIFKTFITHHLRAAWEAFAWPELCQVQEEFFAPTWKVNSIYHRGSVVYYAANRKYYQMIRGGTVITIIGNTPLEPEYWAEASAMPYADLGEFNSSMQYVAGNKVTYDNKVYQCCAPTTAGIVPTDLEHWGEVPPWFRFISKTLDAAGLPRTVIIGEFFGITMEDPRAAVQPAQAPYVTMFQGTVGAMVFNGCRSVWVFIRRAPPTDLADDALIPARFSEIVGLRAASSMLRTDGKSDQANEFSLLADAAMAAEIEKATTQEQQSFRTDVIVR